MKACNTLSQKKGQTCVTIPAVHHDGPGRGRVGDFNPADEGEQSGGVVRNSVVGPASEVELLDLPHLVETTLREERTHCYTLCRFISAPIQQRTVTEW